MRAEELSAAVARALQAPTVEDVQLSPDGTAVAYVAGSIWIASLTVSDEGADPRPLTTCTLPQRMPRWRPGSGRELAFLAGGPGVTQLCLSGGAGEPVRSLAALSGEVSALEWSPDGRSLALLHTAAGGEWTRLLVLDSATGVTRWESPAGVQVWECCWAPDSRRLAVVGSDAPGEANWYRSWLGLLHVGAERVERLWQPGPQLVRPLFSPDGAAVACLCGRLSDRDVGAGDIWLVPLAGGEPRNLTPGYAGSPTWIEWTTPGRITFTGYEGCEAVLADLDLQGRITRLWQARAGLGHHRWPRFSMAGDTLAVVREDAAAPPEVWLARRGEAGLHWRQATHLHPGWAEWELGEVVLHRWQAPDGLALEGILLLPPGPRPAGPLPLVTAVHGGPTNLWSFRSYLLWHRLLTMLGCAVFLPNPRGSLGRGVAFAEANLADYGGADWADMEAGIDSLVARGLADPDRLGIAGWSYGGFMAAWAVAQTPRFRAAMVGAGISNWVSFHGTTPLYTWTHDSWGQLPSFDSPQSRRSPVLFADQVRTPTLLLHGGADTVVPPGQALEFYRALLDRGVEAHLCLYPGERHFVRGLQHQQEMHLTTLRWFATHLGLA
ncbi:MAG: S9 family peptidase [Bacillota bacterium]